MRNIEASRAFIVLGDAAKNAMPDLQKLYGETKSIESRTAIVEALTWIGPAAKPAIPLLLRAATNSNSRLRANALWALGEIHAEPRTCVPRLLQALDDPDQWARLSAAHALGSFGPDAQAAVPALVELARQPPGSMRTFGIQLQFEARKALTKIAPDNIPGISESLFPLERSHTEPLRPYILQFRTNN